MHSTHRELIDAWFKLLFIDHDFDSMARYRDPAAKSEGLSDGPIVGVDAFRAMHERLAKVVRFTRYEILESVEQGDRIAVIVRVWGVTRAGREIVMDGSAIVRIADGKVREARNVWSSGQLAAALGLAPELSISEIAEKAVAK